MSRIYEALKRAEQLRAGAQASQSPSACAPAAPNNLIVIPPIVAKRNLLPALNYSCGNVGPVAWLRHNQN
jgi:hypothetical protein